MNSRLCILCFAVCIALLGGLSSCKKTIGPTIIEVQDSVRHYYPVVQGSDLRMSYRVYNRGNRPLVLTDVLPSCNVIEFIKEPPRLIPSGDSANLVMVFHSLQNIGFAEHKVRLYGNFNDGVATITFDVHIVRPTLDKSDYEEHYFERTSALWEDLVDGTLGEKFYYTDSTETPDILTY